MTVSIGLGPIFSLVVGWVGLRWVTQNGPTDNSAPPTFVPVRYWLERSGQLDDAPERELGLREHGARAVHAAHRQRLEAVETQRRDAVALVVDAVAGRVQGPRVAQLLARQTLDHLATVGVHAQRPPPRPVMVHHLQRTRRCKLDRFCRAGLGQSAAALFQRRPPLPQWRN